MAINALFDSELALISGSFSRGPGPACGPKPFSGTLQVSRIVPGGSGVSGLYTGTVTFTRVDSSFATTTTDTGRVRVDATVNWTGVGTDHGPVTLTTLITQ